jgi:hypothetical protein
MYPDVTFVVVFYSSSGTMDSNCERLAQALAANEAYEAELKKMMAMLQNQEREIIQRIAKLKGHMRYIKISPQLRRGREAVAALTRVQMAQRAKAAAAATENFICPEISFPLVSSYESSSIMPYFHEDIVLNDSRCGVIKSVLSTPEISEDGLFLRNVRSRMMVFNKKPRHWTKSELIVLREETIMPVEQGEQMTSKIKNMTEHDWDILAMLLEANNRTVEECKRQASCSSTYLAGASPWSWSAAEDRQLECLVAQRSRDFDWTCIATTLSQTTSRDGAVPRRRALLPVECLQRYQLHVVKMKHSQVPHQDDEDSITSKSVQRQQTVRKKHIKRQRQPTIIQKESMHPLKKKESRIQRMRRLVLKEWCYRDETDARVSMNNRIRCSIMHAMENEGQLNNFLKRVPSEMQNWGV